MVFNFKTNPPMYDVRVGLVFYSYINPNDNREKFKEFVKEIDTAFGTDFTYYRLNSEYGDFKTLKHRGIDFLNSFFDKKDFEETQHLVLTNASEKVLHNIKLEMILYKICDEFPVKIPNTIYMELSPQFNYDSIMHFISKSFQILGFHFACANIVFGGNDHLTRGINQAFKQVKLMKTIAEPSTIWLNYNLISAYNRGIITIDCIQVYSKEFFNKLNLGSILSVNDNNFYYLDVRDNHVLLSLSQERFQLSDDEYLDKYKKMKQLLKPILVEIKKPTGWKPDEWETWSKRLD